MNILLLDSEQITGTAANISGRHLQHLQTVQKLSIGDSLRVGEVNGLMGTGTLVKLDNQSATLELDLHTAAPTGLPLTLVLALPRPKMLRRILQMVSSMGIKRIDLINSARTQ